MPLVVPGRFASSTMPGMVATHDTHNAAIASPPCWETARQDTTVSAKETNSAAMLTPTMNATVEVLAASTPHAPANAATIPAIVRGL